MMLAAIVLDAIVELVLVFQPVEQTGLQTVGRGQRCAVDQPPYAVGREMAMGRGLRNNLVEDIADQRVVLAPLRRRKILLREHVGGALVLADSVKVGLDLEPVEHPARKHFTDPYAQKIHLALRHHRDFVGGARDQVRQVAGARFTSRLDIGAGPLSVLFEIADQVAQLLRLRKLHLRVDDLDRESYDARIILGVDQSTAGEVERRLVRVEHSKEGHAAAFGHRSVQFEHENRARAVAMRHEIAHQDDRQHHEHRHHQAQ